MLKALFGSKSRISILRKMYENPSQAYFVRELTRELGEQVNSVRRELISLKKIGLLTMKSRNRKKYFALNKNFLIYVELRNIFNKTSLQSSSVNQFLEKAGKIDLLILSGVFIGDESAKIDLLVVGDMNKEKLQKIIVDKFNYARDVRYAVLDHDGFMQRIEFKDKFIIDLLKSPDAIIEVNNMERDLVDFLK